MIDSYEIFGRYYGFPQCCIDSFRTMKHVGGKPRKLTGTGYIPCLKCNEKSEEDLVAEITKLRVCKSPFPECESYEDLLKNSAKAFSIDWNDYE